MTSPAALSTGQTLEDLVLLDELRNLSGAPKQDGWIPPAFLDPNYVPPVKMAAANLYTGTVLLSIVTILVFWKIITTQRTRSSNLLFLEDWLLIFALVGAIAYMVIVWLTQQHQIGWHVYDIKYRSIIELYKLGGISSLMLIWIYCTSRASLLVSVRRMYSPLETRLKIVIDLLAIGKFFTLVICMLVFVFASPKHPDAPFNLITAIQQKVNILDLDTRIMAAQVSVDVIVLLSPVPLLWKLKNLPLRRKWQLVALCGFGASTIVAGFARLGILISLRNILYQDFSWHLPIIGIANNMEMFLAMVTACVPTANLFFKWAYDKPRIPAASSHRRRTIRKYRRKRDPNSTIDTVETNATGDTFDTEWSKGDTLRSDWSRTESLQPLNRARTPKDQTEYGEPISTRRQRTAILDTKDLEFPLPPPSRHRSIESSEPLQPQVNPFPALRKGTPSVQETEENAEDEEDNFYEMLVPSDAFFPWGTGLRPRPPAHVSCVNESYELQNV